MKNAVRTPTLAGTLGALCLVLAWCLAGCAGDTASPKGAAPKWEEAIAQALQSTSRAAARAAEQTAKAQKAAGLLESPADVQLTQVETNSSYYDGLTYVFSYDDEEFYAYYEPDCWTIYDSYKITNQADMECICQALLNEHSVHGQDLESLRTAADMAFEWHEHNLAYTYLPEDSPYRESAQNVDLDAEDQYKTLEDFLFELR